MHTGYPISRHSDVLLPDKSPTLLSRVPGPSQAGWQHSQLSRSGHLQLLAEGCPLDKDVLLDCCAGYWSGLDAAHSHHRCCFLIRPCCPLIRPCCFLIRPCCCYVRPCCFLIKRCCFLIRPCCSLIWPCCFLIRPCCFLIWPCRFLIREDHTHTHTHTHARTHARTHASRNVKGYISETLC